MKHFKYLIFSLLLLASSSCKGNIIQNEEKETMKVITNPKNQNVELGKVTWLRDYNEALEESALKNKPVLLFFQEIPGCSTCVNYGRDVLSHPLMVEFIENEFIPLAIYNNKPGKDAEILKKYNEPSWNNPVTHFVDSKGDDIVNKLAHNYQPLAMYNKMVEVLETLGKPIPLYAKALGNDLKIEYGYFKTTVYETPCFWSGETTLAQHPGVVYTEAGWIGGAEVVKVFFDAKKASLETLDNYAKQEGFYTIGNHENYRIDKTPQYYLSRTTFASIPLSKVQRTNINLAIPYRKDPSDFLSPKQLTKFQILSQGLNDEGGQKVYALDFETSWNL